MSIEEMMEKGREQTRAINRETGSDIDENYVSIVGQHRDSDALEESNYRVISADMKKRFPDDVEEHSFGHWAVGWIEEFFVRMADKNGEPTPAFLAAIEWKEALENYPVADEEDFSELENEQEQESWESWGRQELAREIGRAFPEVDLDLPDSFLDSIRDNSYERAEMHSDGPSFPLKQWAEDVTREMVESFGDFAEYDRARMEELPPYLREPVADPKQEALAPYLREVQS